MSSRMASGTTDRFRVHPMTRCVPAFVVNVTSIVSVDSSATNRSEIS